jgi:signal transduction histidine kinase/CheY-like chemotaxis protein
LAGGSKRVIGLGREVEGRRSDGTTLSIELGVSEALTEAGRLFIGTLRDITGRKQVERLKQEFVSTVSHELRTPLTSIRGSLGLLVGGAAGALPPQTRMLLDVALKNSERLILLINDLLDIEKLDSGKERFELRPIEVSPVVAQALEAVSSLAQVSEIRLEHSAPANQVKVLADRDRFRQVLDNLISNALKFSPKGGTVRIEVTAPEASVRVSVSDQGPGIPEDFRVRVFQRFAQADSSDTKARGGTGLGLAISKTIMDRLGGTLTFDSVPGQGTTFHATLPCLPGQPDLASTARTAGPGTRPVLPAGARVLVVEDDADTAMVLQTLFSSCGFAVDLAGSAAETRSMLAAHTPDVMTLDLRLPDQSGVVLLEELRRERSLQGLPVIVISASESPALRKSVEALQPVTFLLKPVDLDRLLGLAHELAERRMRCPLGESLPTG